MPKQVKFEPASLVAEMSASACSGVGSDGLFSVLAFLEVPLAAAFFFFFFGGAILVDGELMMR